MKPLKNLAAALLLTGVTMSGLTLSGAAAMTPEQEAELVALLENAEDASSGADVGDATITAAQAAVLHGEAACTFSRLLNADEFCATDAIVFPPQGAAIDSIYYSPPEEIGYVDMEEWTEDATAQIDEIWQSYVEGSKAQSERIGFEVAPVKWVLYPTLNKDTKVMTYGILLNFGGEEVINLHAIKFTRNGFVEMNIVTDGAMLADASKDFDAVATYASNTYAPDAGFRYADFKDGDKIAAIGAVGVLASVMGVEYSKKGTLAAIGAAILLFAKKLWFLLLAIPVMIWGGVKKFFGGRKPVE
jgi:uncharacterized membrane-anchored protein